MSRYNEFAEGLLGQIRQCMFGLDEVTQLTLVALYTDGHILLEGNPGTPLTNIRNFGNPNHTCFGWMHWFCHARGLHTSAECSPGTVPAWHEP